MDLPLLSALSALPVRSRDELEQALSKLLVQLSEEGAMTVKGVRDRFSAINRHAKAGRAQVIGSAPGEQTVIVSVKDLAAMMQAAASSLTFGDALAAADFEPVGAALVAADPFERETDAVLAEERETAMAAG